MSDAERGALRQGLAAAGTALLVGALHVPQPFLAVLASQLIGGLPCPCGMELLRRCAAAWAGTFAGLLLLVAAPDQQWVSLPLFCVVAGFGITGVFRRMGPASGILFAMGLGGMFSAGIVFPASGLVGGMAHASSLSAAVFVSALTWNLCMGGKPPPPTAPPPSLSPWVIGLGATGSLILACLAVPAQAVVMTIATMTALPALHANPSEIRGRSLGALLGMASSALFLAVVSGAGNDLAVFLAALAITLGAFEGMAVTHPGSGGMFRQAAAVVAVVATLLPRPDPTLEAATDRLLAVACGFAVAGAFSLLPSPYARMPRHAGLRKRVTGGEPP